MDFSEIPIFGDLISDTADLEIKRDHAPSQAAPRLEMSFAQTAWKNENPNASHTIQSPTSPVKEFRPQILKRIPPPPVAREQINPVARKDSNKPAVLDPFPNL
jgi:hypothetical protein